ncbi:leukocyte surface antigen CD47 isoform X2 [Zootoca vivipara]|uniref:leukocyte surface antigen CD47 isoform X2 n=1 Tax=Zootoca vivipara TaxID=8524 RepID=UPI00293BC1A0|nr:leukocyte surface antigen CD47 isoform X2 [Zootoca vivipara]
MCGGGGGDGLRGENWGAGKPGTCRAWNQAGDMEGSAQLTFLKITSLSFDICNTSNVILPCIVTNLKKLGREDMYIQWDVNGKEFFSFDGYENRFYKNLSYMSVDFLNIMNLTDGDASITIPLKNIIPGNYTCQVVESNREGEMIIDVRYGSSFWFQPVESSLIIGAVIMLAALFLLQVGYVAMKFEMSLIKKISFGVAVLILMIFVVPGASLLVKEGYTIPVQFGLGLVVLPTIILVPPLFFVFQSVFEKPPVFEIILIVLKTLGYIIAVAGIGVCLPECPPKQASVVIAGLGIMDLVAVIAFIYMVVIGTRFKDHQPPKKTVGEPLNDAKGVMLE